MAARSWKQRSDALDDPWTNMGPHRLDRRHVNTDGFSAALATSIRAAFEGLAMGGATRQVVAAAMAAACRCTDPALKPSQIEGSSKDISEYEGIMGAARHCRSTTPPSLATPVILFVVFVRKGMFTLPNVSGL